MKNIYLLGCTGSIGKQSLDVIRNLEDVKVKSISFAHQRDEAMKIIDEFKPEFVSCLLESDALYLKNIYPNITFSFGKKSLIEAACYNESDNNGYLLNALVGMIGLEPTIEAIKIKRNILLANKETLVVGGEIIKELVKEYGVKLLPIDSEHSAIMQCLEGFNKAEVSEIIITASGGAFRDYKRSELEDVNIDDAINHPNWSMGKKISVDSSTMLNKGLEVIEAHYLFDMPYNKIKTIIHRESIIHSMVKYNDGSVIAQLGKTDMRIPIQYAITYPNKLDFKLNESIDFDLISTLSFEKMDFLRFPLLKLAYEVGELGGILPTVYNSSNEACVNLFIEGKIKFLEIESIIFEYVQAYKNKNIDVISLDDILRIDNEVKESIYKRYL